MKPFHTGDWDGLTYKRRLLVYPDVIQITDAINGALSSILYTSDWETGGNMTADDTAQALKRMWLDMTSKILDVGDIFMTSNPNSLGDRVHECNGAVLSISDYPALYAVVGTTWGGDGVTSFQLPDLRGRFARGAETFSPIGTTGGSSSVTLDIANMPPHTHTEQGAFSTLINGGVEAPASAAVPAPTVTGSAGLGTPFDITPPFASVRYVMVVR